MGRFPEASSRALVAGNRNGVGANGAGGTAEFIIGIRLHIAIGTAKTGREALDRGIATIRKNCHATVKKGRLAPGEVAERLALLSPTLSWDDLGHADLLIEAAFEEMAVKEEVLRKPDARAKPGAILATDTSALDVNRIAAATKRPGDVVGLHFFSPANVMKPLEVVRGGETAKDVLATVTGVAVNKAITRQVFSTPVPPCN